MGTTLKMPDGRPVPPLVLMVPPADYDPIRTKAGELIAKNLRALGVDVVAKSVGFDTLVGRMNGFDYDMLIIGWSLSSDPISNVFDTLGPTSSTNFFGWWGGSVENPWYSHLGGVSSRADAATVAMAEKFHNLSELAHKSFDRDSQVLYTKWGQGIVSRSLPLDVLYYRVNNYPVSTAWTGWIPQLGDLLNVYTLGALTSEEEPPLVENVNALLNVPDKLPLGVAVPGNVIVFDEAGTPIYNATVDLSGTGVAFSPVSGTTDPNGVFHFNVTGYSHNYHIIEAEAALEGDRTTRSKVVQVVAGVPETAFLQVRPDRLFLGPGESTDLVLNVTDENGVGIENVDVELDEGLMGWGSVNITEATTNASGGASIMYTAPSTLPLNRHQEVRLYLSPKAFSHDRVNTVTQVLVLRNEEDSDWHLVTVEDVTRYACNETMNTTVITVKAVDEGGNPLQETLGVTYSNKDVLATAPSSVTTDSAGIGKVTVAWRLGIDTNATQVFFENPYATNSVGAGVALLYEGATARDIYGGSFSLKDGGAPIFDPDSGGNLTWEVHVYDLDGRPADVNVSFIIGQPSDGSTAEMAGAPWYMWSSLWDYSSINVFTDSDGGAMATGGQFLSDLMSDAELAAIPDNYFQSWQDVYDSWYGGEVDELEAMRAVSVSNGLWEVSIVQDQVVLGDNVPSLVVIPEGRAGFYATPDYVNFWWQVEGETAWRTGFVMGRTNSIQSPKYEFPVGILRDLPPGNTTDVDIWVYDHDEDPVANVDVDAFVQVYGGSSFFAIKVAGETSPLGQTSATVTGLTMDGRGNPLVNPVKQPMYIEPDASYGWNVMTSVEIFNYPVQLYVDLSLTPITSQAVKVTEVTATARVFDEFGTNVSDFTVDFWMDGHSITDDTDANGEASVTLPIPDIPLGSSFGTWAVRASVTMDGYGAASASHSLLSHSFENLLPVLSDLSIPDTGYETQNTTWNITGRATDDWSVSKVTASLDGADPMELTLIDGNWTFPMVDLSRGEHTVTFTVEDQWGLQASRAVTFTVLLPPNDPPVIGDLSIPDTGYETLNTTWSITGRASDDWSIVLLTARLDGRDPVNLTLTAGRWEFSMVDLTVGEHTVTFTVEDEWGLSINRTVTFTVLPPPNKPPVITGLSIPDTGHETQETSWSIVLRATDDGPITLVTASLDGGDPVPLAISEGAWPFHMDDLAVGEHTVTFVVEDHEGLTDERTVTFLILEPPNDPPVIEDLGIPDTGHETGESAWSLSGRATDDWSIVRVTATLDGEDPEELVISEGQWSFEMEDLALGEHTVTITVEDEWGLSVSRTLTFQVIDAEAPLANVYQDINTDQGIMVTFDGTGSQDNVGVVNWTWEFTYDEDEMRLYGEMVELTFANPGNYSVSLTVADAAGNTNSSHFMVNVRDAIPPVAVVEGPSKVKVDHKVELDATGSTDNTDIVKWTWRFTYKGEEQVIEGSVLDFNFGKAGTYEVVLTVVDGGGNTDQVTHTLKVEEEAASDGLGWMLLVAVVVAVAVVAVALYMLRDSLGAGE